MYQKQNENVSPTAHLTINKSRLKSYNNNSNYYLKDNDEFQIELFNPTNTKVLAVIEIDGNNISSRNTGIVLRPAERVFLERYLDEAKKFVYKTYSVSGGEELIQQATKENGLVTVSFYNVEAKINLSQFQSRTMTSPKQSRRLSKKSKGFNNQTDFSGNLNANVLTTTTSLTDNSINFATTNTTGDVTFDSFGSASMDTLSFTSAMDSIKTTESGTVEKGTDSDQEFGFSDDTFSPFPTTKVQFKILPISSRPVESKDLVKRYCSQCGGKVSPKDKFCKHCASKL